MSDVRKQNEVVTFQGKSGEPETYEGIEFRFPFSKFLPEPTKSERERFIEDIRTRGIRKPLSIRIDPRFRVDPKLPTGKDVPPVMVEVKNERLIKRHRKAPKQEPERLQTPVVAVIDGEIRLRTAIRLNIPLDQILFREYRKPRTENLDEKIKTCYMQNNSDREKYDALPKEVKEKHRFIFDLWLSSTTRRGGMSNDGYRKLVYIIDRMYHGQFTRLSGRRMADLLGINRNRPNRLRREIGASAKTGEPEGYLRLKRVQQLKDTVSSAQNSLDELVSQLRSWGKEDEIPDEHRVAYEQYVDSIVDSTGERLNEIMGEINDEYDNAYDQAIEEKHGIFEVFEIAGKTVAEKMDEIIFGNDADRFVSSTPVDDIFTLEYEEGVNDTEDESVGE